VWEDLDVNERRVIDPVLRLAVGCRAMITNNAYQTEFGLANGSEVIVRELTAESITVGIDGGESVVMRPTRILGVSGCVFYPLKPGYARTTYKVQGATINRVCLWANTIGNQSTQNGVVYVAMTRVRCLKDFMVNGSIRAVDQSRRTIAYMRLAQESADSGVIATQMELLPVEKQIVLSSDMEFAVTRCLSAVKKSIFKGKMEFLTRYQQACRREQESKDDAVSTELPRFKLFNKKIFYDFETAPKRYGDKPTEDDVYGVYARYWDKDMVKSTFQEGVLHDGGLAAGPLDRFCDWLFNIMEQERIAYRDERKDGKKKNRVKRVAKQAPIQLIAFNG
jgi:ATP-dependent exoDNAse (exonuclease V) alpha subunit